MKTFMIYQPILSDARADEVNEKGWAGVAWGPSYMKLTSVLDESDAEELALEGAEHMLFEHTWTVEAETVDQTFGITNGVQEPTGVFLRTEMAKSGSVGDVAYNPETRETLICLSFGWHEMSDEARTKFFDLLEASR